MIRFIYGDSGTGKTERIFSYINKDVASGRNSLLIVPEQMTVAVEREAVRRLPASAQLSFEVVNFTRLANKIFRLRGGLAYNFASPAFQKLVMMRAIRIAAPLLSEYKLSTSDETALADAMLSTYKELSAAGIAIDSLEKFSFASDTSLLSGKIHDITTVCAIYAELIGEKYTDTNNELARFSRLIENDNFFSESNIYIDGFSSFTGIEHKIIKSLMSQTNELTFTISLSSPSYRGIDTVSLKDCSDRLRRDCASLGIKSETILLDRNFRTEKPDLQLLSKDLWVMNSDICIDNDTANFGSVELIRAADIYDECEIAAARIRELIESGSRYHEIAIVARDIDKYRGIIEPALETMELSYFISEKTDPSLCPLSRLIISALRIVIFGWKRNDVIANLKTGLTGISSKDVDIFESYTAKWNINGKQFIQEEPWSMNPDGYTTVKSQRGENILNVANTVRSSFIKSLKSYASELKDAHSYTELCMATVRYLDMINVRDRMTELSAKYISMGKLKEAGEYARMYDALIDALDCVCDAFSDAHTPDLSIFKTALQVALSESKLGSIPTSYDEITIGSADMLRTDNVKCTIILGACDGEFPSNAQSSGLFSDSERQYLIDHDLPLSGNKEMRASDELYYFRRAVSSAAEKLIVFTRADCEPSIAFTRIIKLLSGIKVRNTDNELIMRLRSSKASLEYLPLLRGTNEGEAISRLLKTYNSEADIEISASNDMIDKDVLSSHVGSNLFLSQSKIETFVNCHFSYACKYLLRLDDGKRAEFAYNNIGTFVHNVLEKFLYYVFVTNKGVYPDKETKSNIINLIIRDYLLLLLPDKQTDSARLKHLFERLRTTSELLIDDLLNEFADSSFKPEFFELKIGTADIPSINFVLKNGTVITVSGTIDRVDVYRDNGKAYIRVVDYKTGSKSFSVSDIAEGLNLQLLLYIFSLTKNRNNPFAHLLDGEPVPAGITYLSAPSGKVNALAYNASDDSYDSAVKEIKRSGLILDNDKVLNAVSHSRKERYLMKTSRKNSVVSAEFLEHLYDQLCDVLTNIGNEIISGCANALPKSGTDACKYCSYGHICRASQNSKK